MASIFKPTRIKNGKRIKRKRWYIAYKDEKGNRKVVPGYIDKAATEAKAKQIEKMVELRQAGIAPPEAKAFDEARDAYAAELELLGRDKNYIYEQKRQLGHLKKRHGWQTVADIRADHVRQSIAELARLGRAPRTLNTVRDAVSMFANFCITRNWLEANPVARIVKARAPGGAKARNRRAYTPDELQRLLAAARRGRAFVYRAAVLSGLRRNELRQLEKQDLTPVGERPTWHLRPAITKGRRKDIVPMLPECAELLREHWQQLPEPTSRLFPRLLRSRALNEDIKRAGIVKKDATGREVDFHAFRYTFCSMLGRKLPIQTVRLLMRHRDIRTTCNLYLDLGLTDALEGVLSLPRLLS